ncbi:MAG: hypothetical protein ACRC62_05480 [Microcoleus sp.]
MRIALAASGNAVTVKYIGLQIAPKTQKLGLLEKSCGDLKNLMETRCLGIWSIAHPLRNRVSFSPFVGGKTSHRNLVSGIQADRQLLITNY